MTGISYSGETDPFLFQGGYHMTGGNKGSGAVANGLYHFGARYYDPTTGRWTQVDPLGEKYAFVVGDPINNVDRLGLCIIFSCKVYHEAEDKGKAVVSDIAGVARGFYKGTLGKLAAKLKGVSDKLDRFLYVYNCGKALVLKPKPDFPEQCSPEEFFGIKPEPAY